jgi:hypothetical protein
MSQPQGPLSAVAEPLARTAAVWQSLPLLEKNRRRVGGGAGLIVFCIYVAVEFKRASGMSLGDLLRSPFVMAKAPAEFWAPYAIWGAALVYGVLRLVVGLRGARGPRDIMDGFWHFAFVAGDGALLWWKVYLPADWGGWTWPVNELLGGLYIAGIVSSTLRGWLAWRGMGWANKRLRAVERQQAHGRAREATPAEAAARLGSEAASPARQFRD